MSYSVDDKIVINSDPLSIDETIALLMPSSSKIAITMYAGTWEENIHIQNIPRTLLAKLENDLYYICQELRIQWPDILKIALLLRYIQFYLITFTLVHMADYFVLITRVKVNFYKTAHMFVRLPQFFRKNSLNINKSAK